MDFIIQGHSKTKGLIQLAIEVKFARQGNPEVKWPTKLKADLKALNEKWVVTLNPEQFQNKEGIQFIPIVELANELQRWVE